MKYKLIMLFALPMLLCAIISCNEVKNAEDNSEYSAIKTDEDKKVEADGSFGIESGMIEYQDKNLEGKLTAAYKLYFANYGSLVKLEETMPGEKTTTYIYNDDTKKGVTLFAGRDKANKVFMRQGEINVFLALRSQSGFTKQKDEEILGKNCEVYANNAKSDEGESQLIYWQYKGLLLKEINRLGIGYMFEAIKLEEKPMANDIFSLPNKIELPHNIFD